MLKFLNVDKIIRSMEIYISDVMKSNKDMSVKIIEISKIMKSILIFNEKHISNLYLRDLRYFVEGDDYQSVVSYLTNEIKHVQLSLPDIVNIISEYISTKSSDISIQKKYSVDFKTKPQDMYIILTYLLSGLRNTNIIDYVIDIDVDYEDYEDMVNKIDLKLRAYLDEDFDPVLYLGITLYRYVYDMLDDLIDVKSVIKIVNDQMLRDMDPSSIPDISVWRNSIINDKFDIMKIKLHHIQKTLKFISRFEYPMPKFLDDQLEYFFSKNNTSYSERDKSKLLEIYTNLDNKNTSHVHLDSNT